MSKFCDVIEKDTGDRVYPFEDYSEEILNGSFFRAYSTNMIDCEPYWNLDNDNHLNVLRENLDLEIEDNI